MGPLIEQACTFLNGKVRRTPLEYSSELSNLLGQPTYLKMESMQLTGSFKIRGAFFYLSTLSEEEKRRGVAACSSGNHGLGLAYACQKMGIPCTVFVPKSVDQAKHDKLLKMGARVIRSDFVGYDDTYAWACQEWGRPLIPAYNDERIMAANGGSLAVEVLEDLPEATHFILPMGGGGLSGGFSWYVKSKKPEAWITICQLAECPALHLSLKQGKAVTYMPPIDTLAGGLEGGLGEKCFEVLKSRCDEIAHISEDELESALCWFLKHHQHLIEPTSAVALAHCLFGNVKPKGPIVIVLSGGNVCYSTIQKLVSTNYPFRAL